uniref:Transmembrane protein 214 n=1 Tax=Serinus canaria TaxID=9135 RepID=A0A8C9MXP0_SERCA
SCPRPRSGALAAGLLPVLRDGAGGTALRSQVCLSVCLSPQLDLADLQKELQKSRSVFPENPSVWVKDLAGYLNYKLQAPRSDPVLSQHPHDYPYCLVSKELRSIIRSLLAKASDFLELFFDHCIYTMLQELDKAQGESLHGYRICIQALLLYRPRIATTNLGKVSCLSLLSLLPKLLLLWALQGTALPPVPAVWLGVMLPVLGIKSLSPYAVSYLDRLLMMHPNLTKGFGMIGPKDFFPLLDFAFMPNNSLSPSLQEQLRRLYPRLKVLALGARPEAALHTYFPSFLSRATPACPPAMKEELLTSLSQCLSLDPLSFSVWRQLYTKHLAQSRSVHTDPKGALAVPKVQQSLQETVRSFKVTNEELAARGAGGDTDVAACDTACKELLQRMKGRGLPWWRLLLVLLVLAAGFLLHDVQTHGSFQGTLGSRGQIQLLALCPGGAPGAVSSPGLTPGLPCRWLEHSLAQQGSVALSVLWPQLELLGKASGEVARAVSQQGCSLLSWLQGSLPWLSDWVSGDPALPCPAQGAPVSPVSLIPAGSDPPPPIPCPCFSSGDVTWECVRDHLMSFTYSSWIYLQNATLALKDWALAMISGH